MRTDPPHSVASFEDPKQILAYDRQSPLGIEEAGIEPEDGISIHDISYAGLANGRIRAYLVEPAGRGLFPGVVYVHSGPGSRSSFREEAEILARLGAACLLIEAPWADGPQFGMRASGPPEEVRECHPDRHRPAPGTGSDCISGERGQGSHRLRGPQHRRSLRRNTVRR